MKKSLALIAGCIDYPMHCIAAVMADLRQKSSFGSIAKGT
jgi:hypothetical protein